MPSIDQIVSEQFYRWEVDGRGWKVHEIPVAPEPPFQAFDGYRLPPPIDDGRRPTFLNSLVQRLSGSASSKPPVQDAVEAEVRPARLERESLVELQSALPADLTAKQNGIASLLGQLAMCRKPVAFELVGTSERIVTQFSVAQSDAGMARRQLQAFFPNITFLPTQDSLANAWFGTGPEGLIFELGLDAEFFLPLATKGLLDPLIGLVGAMSELDRNELALFQVIFESTAGDWHGSAVRALSDTEGKTLFPHHLHLVRGLKEKFKTPLYAALVRLAVKAKDNSRVVEIAKELAMALRVFANPEGNALIPLKNDEYAFESHEEDVLRRQTHRSGMLLSSDELINFVHFPSAEIHSAKLNRSRLRTKAAPALGTADHGLLLGQNQHLGRTMPVLLTSEMRVRHMHILGASGTGKSTLLFNLIRQDIENGEGVAVLDPHGDLVERVLGIIPPHRINDVVLLDPTDEEYSIGFNILSAHSDFEKTLLASDLVSIFRRLSTSWGDQLNSVLNNAILAFLESSQGGTLADLRRFLLDSGFRNEFLETVRDPDIVYYWQKAFPQLGGNKSIGPVLTRLETFLSPKAIRYMVSQKANRLDFADILDHGKIFLAKLPQGQIGKENSFLLGSLLVAKFQQLVMSRQRLSEEKRQNFWLYIDEFHSFITPSMAEILTGASTGLDSFSPITNFISWSGTRKLKAPSCRTRTPASSSE